MLKPERFPIDKIYVPVKKRKNLKSKVVRELAESILENGQQAPILVRPDEDRFVLVEGLHRLEACKALGETTIIGLLVSAQVARHEEHHHQDPQAEAERQKTERLRKLRLEKEAAEKLAAASSPAPETESVKRPRELAEKRFKTTANRRDRSATPTTLSDWFAQQEREGNRY